jgi:broad specificity phosphatase PhoE
MRSGEFISMMELFFRRPGELVLGRETAEQAKLRFTAAVRREVDAAPAGNVAIVSHGTVISLLLQEAGRRAPFETWRAMGLPSYAIIGLPDWELLERKDRI